MGEVLDLDGNLRQLEIKVSRLEGEIKEIQNNIKETKVKVENLEKAQSKIDVINVVVQNLEADIIEIKGIMNKLIYGVWGIVGSVVLYLVLEVIKMV